VADLRITPSSQALTPTRAAGASESVKAAQRAFFNAALGQAPAQTVVKSVAATASTAVQPVITPRTIMPQSTADSARPTRILRPGSLLDIKV
jgi:hypothetical protein